MQTFMPCCYGYSIQLSLNRLPLSVLRRTETDNTRAALTRGAIGDRATAKHDNRLHVVNPFQGLNFKFLKRLTHNL